MIFTPAPVAGVWIVDLERHDDERGFFARTWCVRELEQHGLEIARSPGLPYRLEIEGEGVEALWYQIVEVTAAGEGGRTPFFPVPRPSRSISRDRNR